MGMFDRYAFSKNPAYNEPATRKAFAKAVPLKTLVIYCYDPRAVEIPGCRGEGARQRGLSRVTSLSTVPAIASAASSAAEFSARIGGRRCADAAARSACAMAVNGMWAQHLHGES